MSKPLDRAISAHPSPGHEGSPFKRLSAVAALAFLIVVVGGGAASARGGFSATGSHLAMHSPGPRSRFSHDVGDDGWFGNLLVR